jgi:hypothetical protein
MLLYTPFPIFDSVENVRSNTLDVVQLGQARPSESLDLRLRIHPTLANQHVHTVLWLCVVLRADGKWWSSILGRTRCWVVSPSFSGTETRLGRIPGDLYVGYETTSDPTVNWVDATSF